MPRYIDAEPILQKYAAEINKSEKYTAYECGLDDAYFYVNNAPTADVQEVKHAHWNINEAGYYECSNCESLMPYDGIGVLKPEYATYWECDYCRVCGAKMDKGELE